MIAPWIAGQESASSRDDIDDNTLVRLSLAGDEAAFTTLYYRHDASVRAVLRRSGRLSDADLDDAMQDAWIGARRALQTFAARSKFRTWLTAIGIRAAYDLCRPRAPLVRHPEMAIAVRDPDPDAQIDVERLLARLPTRQRDVVVLYELQGYKHHEIAARLGIVTGTSKSTLHRARATLRRML